MLTELQHKLIALTNPEDAKFLQRFFKTGTGQYGEGDLFRGIRVPVLRNLSKEYQIIPLEHVISLLQSAYHEERLLALFILVLKYAKDLDTHCRQMPRRMLRYAIEKYQQDKRLAYLNRH